MKKITFMIIMILILLFTFACATRPYAGNDDNEKERFRNTTIENENFKVKSNIE